MKTRPGTRNDAGAISELLVALSERHIVVAFGEEGRSNLLGSMTPVAIEGFFDAGFRYHLGFDGEQLVGVVGTRDDQHLFHLFVHDEHQGNGHARTLWGVARDACLASGHNPGWFTVNASLNARGVYEHWGFVPIGGIREGGGVRDVPMRMDLGD